MNEYLRLIQNWIYLFLLAKSHPQSEGGQVNPIFECRFKIQNHTGAPGRQK